MSKGNKSTHDVNSVHTAVRKVVKKNHMKTQYIYDFHSNSLFVPATNATCKSN